MIPIPTGFFGGGYNPYGDSGLLFGVSMLRAQDWDIVNTNELRLRDVVTGNFAFSGNNMRREDNGATKCWVPSTANDFRSLSFSTANASWATLMRACPNGVSVVIAGYSKVSQNITNGGGTDHFCRGGITFTYKTASVGGANRIWWDSNRSAAYADSSAVVKQQFFTLADTESGVGYKHDDIPGCITTPAASSTITTPGYVAGDFCMWTQSLSSTGPKIHFNTMSIPAYLIGGTAGGHTADVRPAAFAQLNSGCSVLTNSSMRTMFVGIYNEPLSNNPAKLAAIYNALRTQ